MNVLMVCIFVGMIAAGLLWLGAEIGYRRRQREDNFGPGKIWNPNRRRYHDTYIN